MRIKLKTHSIASVLAVVIVVSALSIIHLVRWLNDNAEQEVTVRNIDIAVLAPPPPPPPPMEQPPLETPTISISQPGTGVAMQLDLVEPEIEQQQEQLDIDFQPKNIDWSKSLTVDWNAFNLDQLDGLPHLLSKVKFDIPTQLKRLNIKKFDIALNVLIDEDGRVTLININENPYPVFTKEISRFVKRSKFSVPTKNGEPVRAKFIWPIEVLIK